MLSTRQNAVKRGRDRAREARWAAAQPEQLQQQTSTTTAPAVAPGGDELQPLWATVAAAAAAPQAAPVAADGGIGVVDGAARRGDGAAWGGG